MIKKIIFTFVLLIVFIFNISKVNAQLGGEGQQQLGGENQQQNKSGASVTIKPPINITSPQALVARIIKIILGVVGSIALLMFIFGGLTWMTSAGSPDKVTKGKNIIIWASIGMAIIFSSYALVNFLITSTAT